MLIQGDCSEQAKDKDIGAEKVKCSKCNRELRFSSEWIGDHQNALCEACYENIAFPFLREGMR